MCLRLRYFQGMMQNLIDCKIYLNLVRYLFSVTIVDLLRNRFLTLCFDRILTSIKIGLFYELGPLVLSKTITNQWDVSINPYSWHK